MSTNVSFTGLSIKINEDKTQMKSLQELAKFLEYSEKELDFENPDQFLDNLYDTKKQTWRIFRDVYGVYGLIYLIDDEYDVFDLEFRMSLEAINECIGQLLDEVPQEFLDMEANNVNVFSYLYYNGTDNPFKF